MASPTATLTVQEVEELNRRFENQPPQAVLKWGLNHFGHRIALSSSFGAEDVALIDMMWRIHPGARILTLDTLRLPTETYEVIDRIRQKYEIVVETFCPDPAAVQEMVSKHGHNLFYRGIELRKLCCGVRKVEPLGRALDTVDAWVAGLRRDQVVTRALVGKVEVDEAHPGKIKLNPMADWSSEQVWAYIRQHDVPYNTLHDQGFPSIGCAPCTRAVSPDEDPRAGRWWWELDPAAKECGLHVAEAPIGEQKLVQGRAGS